jgi:hypothetical protein
LAIAAGHVLGGQLRVGGTQEVLAVEVGFGLRTTPIPPRAEVMGQLAALSGDLTQQETLA